MFTALGAGGSESAILADAIDRPRALSTANSESDNDQQHTKRRRVTRACDICKSRKRRCTGEQPCSFCADHGSQCTYDSPYARGKPSLAYQANMSIGGFRPVNMAEPAGLGATPQRPRSIAAPTTVAPAPRYSVASRIESPHVDSVTPSGQYLGPTSPLSFIRRAAQRFESAALEGQSEETGSHVSIFKVGDRTFPDLEPSNLEFPNLRKGKKLINHYFEFAAPTYRFLHKPTVLGWFEQTPVLPPIRRAILLLVFATAMLYDVDSDDRPNGDTMDDSSDSENMYQAAERLLERETGPPRLISVQARLTATLYLLNTARLSQSWYTFGQTTQMMTALGFHRKGTGYSTHKREDSITSECRKRCFWAAYTLDLYLSVMLGRPPLIDETYADQEFPQQVNDEDLRVDGVSEHPKNMDCVMAAPVLHSQLSRIVRRAAKDHHLLYQASEDKQIQNARLRNQDLQAWKSGLPVFLSGAIHPLSLIPTFRRQLTVLRMATMHARMLINRPLLLSRNAHGADIRHFVEACISAAKETFDMVLELVEDEQLIPAFWNTQFVAFNALSIVYVWILQRKFGLPFTQNYSYSKMFDLAETVQKHLAAVTRHDAPNMQYNAVLAELQEDARRSLQAELTLKLKGDQTSHGTGGLNGGEEDQKPPSGDTIHGNGDMPDLDLPFDYGLWLQMDSAPFNLPNNFSTGDEQIASNGPPAA